MEAIPDSGVVQHDRIEAEVLFREHARFVAGFLQRLGITGHDVDDLVQEVFLVAHRKGGYVTGPAKPRTWLAAIARRVASQGRRKERSRRDSSDEAAILDAACEGVDPSESYELREALSRVQRALDTLDLDHRLVFLLYEVEGAACPQIAVATEVPLGTVYSRLHYARQRFLAAYEELVSSEPADERARYAAPLLVPALTSAPPLRLRLNLGAGKGLRAGLRAEALLAAPLDVTTGLRRLGRALAQEATVADPPRASSRESGEFVRAPRAGSIGSRAFARLAALGRAAGTVAASTVVLAAPPRAVQPSDPPQGRAQAELASVEAPERSAPLRPNTLRKELEELARIKLLVDVEPAKAYRLAQASHALFKDGAMNQEREALAVLALWKSGQYTSAARAAQAFIRRYPHGPMRDRIAQLQLQARR